MPTPNSTFSRPKAHIAVDNSPTREVPTTEVMERSYVMERSLVETQVLELHWGSRYKEKKKSLELNFMSSVILSFCAIPVENDREVLR